MLLLLTSLPDTPLNIYGYSLQQLLPHVLFSVAALPLLPLETPTSALAACQVCVRVCAAYQQVPGRGGKVKRVLANRQSAQRSRIRKLQHISELEVTLEALQDDLFKLNPQLTKLEAKQAGVGWLCFCTSCT